MYKRFALNSHTHWIEFEGNSLADKKLEKISATQRLSWIVCGFVSIFLSLYGWHKNGHKCHFESQCFNPVILFIDCDYENLWELCILPMWDFIAFNCIAYKSCDTHYKLVKKIHCSLFLSLFPLFAIYMSFQLLYLHLCSAVSICYASKWELICDTLNRHIDPIKIMIIISSTFSSVRFDSLLVYCAHWEWPDFFRQFCWHSVCVHFNDKVS